MVPPGRIRAGLFHALARQQLKREVAISVTNFFAVAEMVAVTDYCATLPSLVCPRLAHDPRLKVLSPPADLGTFRSRWSGTCAIAMILRTVGSGPSSAKSRWI